MSELTRAINVLSSLPTSKLKEHGNTARYDVKFVNCYEGFDEPLEINFTADTPDDVKAVVSALSAFYSGDPYECFINGEQAVLENDWGLAEVVPS